jgi:methyl-accepting chemotaxis protein
MRRFFTKMSINKRFALLIGLLNIVVIASFMLITRYIAIHEADQIAINMAAKSRHQAQVVYLYADRLAQGDSSSLSPLLKNINSYEAIQHHLVEGGVKPELSSEMEVQAAEGELLISLKKALALWAPYKANIDIILSEYASAAKENQSVQEEESDFAPLEQAGIIDIPRVKTALKYLRDKEADLYAANNTVTRQCISRFDASKVVLTSMIWGVVLLNSLMLILGHVLIRRHLIKPLESITVTAEKITRGDETQNIVYTKEDEIGKIAGAINTLNDTLKNATNFIQRIGKGELNAQYHGLATETKADENSLAGALLNMRNQMLQVAEKEKQRNWATEGLARFVEILRSNTDDTATFTHKIISSTVEYVQANQGALFLLNDENKDDLYLEMVSCYAYNKRKYLNKRFELGEGLVGQTYLEQETIYMTEVPQDFVSIRSGLGGANPGSVLIVPLKINDVIHGVMELASFRKFLPHEIEFIEKLSENIASTLANVKTNLRTRVLLEESQYVAEAMRAQEEELRQNMEELEATQEGMRRAQQEIMDRETRMTALMNNTESSIAAADTNFKLTFFNAQYQRRYKAFGVEVRLGMDMRSFSTPEQVKSFERALAGDTFVTKEHFKNASIDSYFETSFQPVTGIDKEIIGLSIYASDITKRVNDEFEKQCLIEELQRNHEELQRHEAELKENLAKLTAAQEELNKQNNSEADEPAREITDTTSN